MKYAWIVRPYPHDYYRIKEFLNENIVAIGWPNIGDLTNCKTRERIKKALRKYYSYSSPQSLGQAAGNIYRFIHEMKAGSYVIVPDGQLIYFGIVNDEYIYEKEKDSDDQGYCHQRPVKWLYDKKAISRNLLTGRVYDSLKGQQTVFTTYHEDIEDIVRNKKHFFTQQPNFDLKTEYLKKLQSGLLKHVNSNTFENSVCSLFSNYFPGLRRLATTNSKKGDTDLIAELPGKVIVRIQVKHFYPEYGAIEKWVVEQLAESMETGDHGIIITSGTIGSEAKRIAELNKDKSISFIDGQQFVDILFENINNLRNEELVLFGLTNKIDFL